MLLLACLAVRIGLFSDRDDFHLRLDLLEHALDARWNISALLQRSTTDGQYNPASQLLIGG